MNIRQLGNPVGRAEFLETYNGGGPDNVTSTTTSEPPAFLQQLMGNVSGGIGSRFSAQDPFNNPGADTTGSQIIPGAQNLVNRTIGGDFLSPDSNPFLQQTFNRAADLTRGRLDTEFAGAGRNIGASMPARSEELQTLASNIYGQNFQAERDRQLAAIDQGQGLDPLNLAINRIAGLIPGAGGSTQSTQPVFRTGLF